MGKIKSLGSWLRISLAILCLCWPVWGALRRASPPYKRLNTTKCVNSDLEQAAMPNLMVTLHPFLADFLQWRTWRTHRSTTLCRACGHTAHALRPSSGQFLMGLRVESIKMEEELLLLENPLLKVLLLEDERRDWVEPIFDEREKCGEFHTWFPMLLEQAQKFFQYF